MSKYLLIEGKAEDVNAISSHYCIGLPSLTTFDGFIKYFNIKFKNEFDIEKYWIGLRDVHYLNSNIKIANTREIGSSKNEQEKILAAPFNELTRKCSFSFSIIVKLTEESFENYKESGEEYYDENDIFKKIKNEISCMSIGGGSLHNVNLEIEDYFHSIIQKIKNKRSTFLIKECSYELNVDNMSRFEKLTELIKRNDDFTLNSDYYSPINIGFQLIEEPTKKDREHLIRGVKNIDEEYVCYDHAFAEPILGLIKFKNLFYLTRKDFKNIKEKDLIEYSMKSIYNEEENSFIIKNTTTK